jgi:hypothetical protein
MMATAVIDYMNEHLPNHNIESENSLGLLPHKYKRFIRPVAQCWFVSGKLNCLTFIDGEMPLETVKKRDLELGSGSGNIDYLRISTTDC